MTTRPGSTRACMSAGPSRTTKPRSAARPSATERRSSMASRGHASIQGSTDIPTLFNILPGYIPMAHAHAKQTLAEFVAANASPTGWWGRLDAYMVSLLKAYFGARATTENDFCFNHLPRISGDHSTYQAALDMLEGK